MDDGRPILAAASRRLLQAVGAGEYPAGSSLPSERVLAERLDVSRVTVRAALRDLEERGVLRANPHGRGRIVAAPPRSPPAHPLLSRSVMVLSLLERFAAGASAPPWWLRADAALVAELHRRGSPVLTLAADDAVAARRAEIVHSQARGLVIAVEGGSPALLAMARAARAAGLAVATVIDTPAWSDMHRVGYDHHAGAGLLVEALMARGARRLLPLATVGDRPGWLRDRLRGIADACARHGLPVLAPVALPDPPTGDGGAAHEARVRHVAGHLVDRLDPGGEPADALLAVTDWHVPALLGAARLLRRRELRVVGYDAYWPSLPDRRFEPGAPFATIDRDDEALGRALAEAVTAPARPPSRVLIPPRLVLF